MISVNKYLSGILILTLGLSSCKIYSFKDVSIPPQVKSIHIGYIENRARLVNPQLAPQLNDKLRQKINQQASRLSQIQDPGADYDVSGTITDYNYTTSGISNQQVASNRLNVTVQVRYTNAKDETKNFDQSFTYYADFPQDQTLNQNEARLLPTIRENLVQQIFNKSAADW